MKKEDITKEFLLEGILSEREEMVTYEQLCEKSRDELQNLLDCLKENKEKEDDEDELEGIELSCKLCEKILSQSIVDYDDYQHAHQEVIGDWDFEFEKYYKKYQKEQAEKEKIESLVSEYIQIIKNLPDDCEYEVSFSAKSPSIYIQTKAAVTESNIEKFENLHNSWYWEYENVYEEYGYEDCEHIEIRLSDHDFGGYTNLDGFGDYISYRHACLNYWKRC